MSIYICLVLVALASVAQNKVSFKTEELKEVANKLKLDSLDTLGVGYSFVARDKHQLVIRKNGDDMIEHIGIKLFPMGYRQQVYVDVLDFLESGLLCNVYHLTRNQLKYMDAKFIRGSWNQMLTLSASASCLACSFSFAVVVAASAASAATLAELAAELADVVAFSDADFSAANSFTRSVSA